MEEKEKIKRFKDIEKILHKIELVWKQFPDLRFFQLLWMLQLQGRDMFMFEDRNLKKELDKYILRKSL